MSEVIVYGLCDANCKHQVLTVDQTIDLIQEMAANGFQVPNGYIPTTAVNSIIEQNTGKVVKLWIGTQAQYDTLTDKSNLFAIISDDKTLQDILDRLNTLESGLNTLENNLDTLITDFSKDEATSFGDYVISKKKLLWSGCSNFVDENGASDLKSLQFDIDVANKNLIIELASSAYFNSSGNPIKGKNKIGEFNIKIPAGDGVYLHSPTAFALDGDAHIYYEVFHIYIESSSPNILCFDCKKYYEDEYVKVYGGATTYVTAIYEVIE